jgi:cytochrome c oxidase assembly protein subunit 15
MSRTLWIRLLASLALMLCFAIVVLGAYVRLSDAGLGCPDWPGCYGHLTPSAAQQDQTLSATTVVEAGKAWREMIHRYAVGTFGALILLIATLGILWRRQTPMAPGYGIGLLALVIVQALLGMLTVTWRLNPLIVTLHLLLGMTTLAALWWLVLRLAGSQNRVWKNVVPLFANVIERARLMAGIGLTILALQIALGGWTSSNYAATACPDLPTCQASWWPHADFRDAFVLWRGLGQNYQGGVLDLPARIAIHFTHRLGALITTLALVGAALTALRSRVQPAAHTSAVLVLCALGLQLLIGISMVARGFPLWLATAHNAGAALLLLATVALNCTLRPAR